MPDPPANDATILLCPGQGAQHVGMGKSWAEHSAASAEIYRRADAVVGMELSRVCFEGPDARLHRTDIAQAAIYVTSVACFRALTEQERIGPVASAAGLSLGEFTALHLAGAFDFDSGLHLVRLRGRAMQETAEAVPGGSGMVALVGADEQQARRLCETACATDVCGHEGQLVPANFNCPGQIVISGNRKTCERALEVAKEMDMRAQMLEVAGAFHSPLMGPAAERLSEALDQTQWNVPRTPVISNVTARPHDGDVASIKKRLVEQLTEPVRWSDSMQWIIQHGKGQFAELAPGKVLAGLMRRIDRKIKVQNFAEPT